MKIDQIKILANFFDIDISQYESMIDQNQTVYIQNKKSTGKINCNYYIRSNTFINFFVAFKFEKIIYIINGDYVTQLIKCTELDKINFNSSYHFSYFYPNIIDDISSGKIQSTDDIVKFAYDCSKNKAFIEICRIDFDLFKKHRKFKVKNKIIDDISFYEIKYKNGFVRFYYIYENNIYRGLVHIKYDDQYYVIIKNMNNIMMMKSMDNLDEINPYKFNFCDEVRSLNSNFDFLFKESSFNEYMEQIDLESIFG